MKKKHFLLILLTLGLFILVKAYYLSLSISNGFFDSQGGDANHYLNIAESIATHFSYSDNNSPIPSESATWRPPVWPLILAAFYRITDNLILLIILKSIFELGLFLWGCYLLFKKQAVFGIALILVVAAILEPQYVKYSLTFLSESLTALLIFLVAVFFTMYKPNDKAAYLLPILAALTILTHPVSVFFIFSVLGIYFLMWIKKHPKQLMVQLILFGLITCIWPLRNAATFDKGLYLTASQGAGFSKAWNEDVLLKFNNVNGDLADETLNLKYVSTEKQNRVNGVLELSNLYKEATFNFIENTSTTTLIKIALKKLKSNFNPFPEYQKNTFIDTVSIPFRIVYLILFIQVLYLLLFKKIDFYSFKGKMTLVVLSIIVGQTMMSVYIYTGLRFNSIYGITLLIAFIILNESYLKRILPWKER